MKDKFWLILFAIVLAVFFVIDYSMDKVNSVEKDLLETVKARGYLIVGVKTDTKPFGFIQNGKNVGFDIDVAHYIANDIFHDENKVKFVEVTPSNRLYILNSKKVDMIIATMTTSSERAEVVNFSNSYFMAGQALLVNSGSRIKTLGDLNNKNVAVLYGSTAERNIRILLPSSNIRGYKTYSEAYHALKSGKISAVMADDTILRSYSISDKSVKLLPKRYTKEFYAVAVRKNRASKSLLKIINLNISSMMYDGTMLKLKRKWKLN